MKKFLLSSMMLGFGVLSVIAQSGTKSPYSQYGLGLLSDQSQGFNRGMSGVFQGFRNGNQVNMQNPASYSAVDSLSMIFDVAVSGQVTNFKEGGARVNVKAANFENAVALFRVFPKFGVSLGIVPYANVGYKYSSSQSIGTNGLNEVNSYSGSGGFHQAYIGFGYELFKGFSLGANVSYFWGEYERSVTSATTESDAYSLLRSYEAQVSSYKLDFGIQYQTQLTKADELTVGATFGLGHKLNADPMVVTANVSNQTTVGQADTLLIKKGLSLPMSLGVGFALSHNKSLTVGADYSLQRWGAEDYPQLDESAHRYELVSGIYKDRHKIAAGADWIPSPMSRRFLNRVHYRIGASYATPYYKINGQDGPKEMTVSAGFGIPLVNSWNNRSVLNVSFQWVNQSAKNLITDNTFRVTIGLTFNERWFAKWKVD